MEGGGVKIKESTFERKNFDTREVDDDDGSTVVVVLVEDENIEETQVIRKDYIFFEIRWFRNITAAS